MEALVDATIGPAALSRWGIVRPVRQADGGTATAPTRIAAGRGQSRRVAEAIDHGPGAGSPFPTDG